MSVVWFHSRLGFRVWAPLLDLYTSVGKRGLASFTMVILSAAISVSNLIRRKSFVELPDLNFGSSISGMDSQMMRRMLWCLLLMCGTEVYRLLLLEDSLVVLFEWKRPFRCSCCCQTSMDNGGTGRGCGVYSSRHIQSLYQQGRDEVSTSRHQEPALTMHTRTPRGPRGPYSSRHFKQVEQHNEDGASTSRSRSLSRHTQRGEL